ncbi:MAG: S24/S26 family peptidase [Acidobacteriaceae bacterium]|jgi:SOS-response transcriptional repressor LexA
MNSAAEVQDAAKRELAAEVIREFGEVSLRVTGTSMLPAVWPGDVITARRQNAAELSPGQIVLCYRNQAFSAHRLIGRCDEGLITRGDSLAYDDPPFREVEVLGAVISIRRDGRSVGLPCAWWHGAVSRMVQRSELCARVLLRLRRLPGWSWAG